MDLIKLDKQNRMLRIGFGKHDNNSVLVGFLELIFGS